MTDPIVEDAYDYMRAHLVGRIRFGEDRLEMRVAPAPDGTLVGSVMVAMLRSMDTALELPDDGEDSLELQVTLEEIKESGPLGGFCDRWQIYHGEPPDVRWARMVIDAGRYKGHFIDGLALSRVNPFAAEEVALCRDINAKHADLLAPAAFASGGHKLAEPKLVGVDPWGFDIRGQLGIARVVCRPTIASAQEALPRLKALASQAGRPT
jgi:hypothetical protein